MNLILEWRALWTLLERETLRFVRIWPQTILPPMVTTALYFIIFGGLIGARLGEVGGVRYMDFIAPGLILMAVISNSYANVVSSFFGAKIQRHIEELMVAPMSNLSLILGFMAGGIARGLAVGLAVTAVTSLFTDLAVRDWGLAILVMLLTAAVFSLAGMLNAIFAKTFDDISIIPTFVLTPLTYLGGVFFSIDLLPQPWREIALFNPLLHMINAFRQAVLGVADVPAGSALALLVGLFITLLWACVFILRKGWGLRG
ncbi:MAG: ABC transporter permease [Halothiobacillaceae bacterium]